MGGKPPDAKRLSDDDEDEDCRESGTLSLETVRPAFDVERYAEDTIGRERLPTMVDEVATEAARLASVLMDSAFPRDQGSAPKIELTTPRRDLEALGEKEQLALLRARLAPMTRIPSLTRKITELGSLIEDSKTAYILGFIDGLLPLETIVEVAGLPELDALRILDRAIDQYVITFREASDVGRLR